MRTLFMGTCDFGLVVAKTLHAHSRLCGVVTRPPSHQDRGQCLKKSVVHVWADDVGVAVFCPPNLREFDMGDLAPDVVVVASYGLLIPPHILDRYPCINVHPSLLPRWRGPNPVGAALLAGDILTGCTIMMMDSGMDTGPLLQQEPLIAVPSDTCGTLRAKLASLAQRMIMPALYDFLDGLLVPVAQSLTGVTCSQKFTSSMGAIDFSMTGVQVMRHIHAFSPDPGAWTLLRERRVKILGGVFAPFSGSQAFGTFVPPLGWVCGDGTLLAPRLVVPEGRPPMSWEAFMCGYKP